MVNEKTDKDYERVYSIQQQIYTLMWMGMKQFVGHLQQYGVTQPQFVTLAALVHHHQPATMQQLSKVALQDAPTMTGIVNRLLNMSLVERTRSEVDRRVVLVQATSAGRELIQKFELGMRDANPISFFRLSDADVSKLETILNDLLQLLLKQNSHTQSISVEQGQQWLKDFAGDPIQFIKNQEESQSQITLY